MGPIGIVFQYCTIIGVQIFIQVPFFLPLKELKVNENAKNEPNSSKFCQSKAFFCKWMRGKISKSEIYGHMEILLISIKLKLTHYLRGLDL